jgi:hypothetical protein
VTLAGAVFLLVDSIHRKDGYQHPSDVPKVEPPPKVLLQKNDRAPDVRRVSPASQTPLAPKPPLTNPPIQNQEQKDAKIAQLLEYATSYEATSLPLIEPSLYSSDAEIRAAALDAVVVLGAREGGAILRKAATATQDPKEAAELLAKADYVELPSITSLNLKIIGKNPPTQKKPQAINNSTAIQGK